MGIEGHAQDGPGGVQRTRSGLRTCRYTFQGEPGSKRDDNNKIRIMRKDFSGIGRDEPSVGNHAEKDRHGLLNKHNHNNLPQLKG